MVETDLHPDWVAGISIGAINAAIIAGNPLERRVERLRAFWEGITASPLGTWADPWFADSTSLSSFGDMTHGMIDQISAFQALIAGAPGFFKPRFPPPWMAMPGSDGATSFYDTGALKTTLESLIDFDRINSREMRFSVGAVNVQSGNFVYFDSANQPIGPEHILASGALPPGFPAIEIDGEFYWDGGLVSNTPLQWVVDSEPRASTLAFQVDLWSSRGEFPKDLTEVGVRLKEIQYSSRTRAATDRLEGMQEIRSALSTLLHGISEPLCDPEQLRLLKEFADRKVYNVVQLIYRSKHYEGNSKDYEFSRFSMAEHWEAGYEDAMRALKHKEILERPDNKEGFRSFDFSSDDGTDHGTGPEPTGHKS